MVASFPGSPCAQATKSWVGPGNGATAMDSAINLGDLFFYAGNVAGQFTAAPIICPGEPFTFTCTVTGNTSGITTWRVNGSIECTLAHRSNSYSLCDLSDRFTARSGTGFGTSGPSYTSTLSGTADTALKGTLVECFGPANNVDPGNRINSSSLEILGKYYRVLQHLMQRNGQEKWLPI